jgi:hypothetical protein
VGYTDQARWALPSKNRVPRGYFYKVKARPGAEVSIIELPSTTSSQPLTTEAFFYVLPDTSVSVQPDVLINLRYINKKELCVSTWLLKET